MTTQNLLVELFVEELPPKALKKLGDSFAATLAEQLRAMGLATAESVVTAYASPRRLAAHITHVLLKAADKAVQQKLMPVAVGLDPAGNPTQALIKKLSALGADVSDPAQAVAALKRAPDGKAEALFYDSLVTGATLDTGLQKALDEALSKLPIPKVMSYQLETDCELPGWSSVNFVRPAHGLVALHGSTVVPVKALGLKAGNSTKGHRFEAKKDVVVLKDADSYVAALLNDGAVIASFAERRAEIVRQLTAAATKLGGGVRAIEDEALLDEVTALVERPNVLVCEFEKEFLAVPQECLILTMKANQKYFPLLDAAGKLTNKFLVVSNISPSDASAVIGGNERVVRPRLADAKFFFDQDRKKTLASRVEGLGKVVYHNKLGTQGERVERVRAIAKAIAQQLGDAKLVAAADTAARLAKTDLLTDMVGEFPELQGIMGGYYARHDGLGDEVANAIEDHYKPRFAGDELPRNTVGLTVALADKLETLVGMFGIGNLPTGDKDPFALRRHALGVIRMLVETECPIGLDLLLRVTADQFSAIAEFQRERIFGALFDFIYERLRGYFKEDRASQTESGIKQSFAYSSQEIEAVLALKPSMLSDIEGRLFAVMQFASLPEAPALAAANKRISNILKKEQEVDAHVSEVLLKEEAEKKLYAALKDVVPQANKQFEAGDYTASLKTLAALRAPVDAFFDGVMVNAEEMDLRLNRQGLLKSLHDAMNRVADLSRLAA
ncbi:glycine--tRNA ligase subunit beta [Curvibacter sp. PAE-UM]|uniref:glycine--tRNA ligase subunit beta n=1 Tax=Curvibacter sp. PAE-UM TaxID=1714344 RepID=UPI00070BD4A1|nr:glycine--tRNA ligase subunit beta [Curvibacter sp. PAE-UM]KRH98906.1 glycyl-tRNA synthetase subunit beta [Curvibacter sp. PAE-UM]